MESRPETIFHGHPVVKYLGWSIGIAITTLTFYWSFTYYVLGRSTVRMEDVVPKDQILLRYIPKDDVQRDYLSKSEVSQNYTRKDEIAKSYLKKKEVQRDYVRKNDQGQECVPKNEIGRYWIPKEDVQRDYVNKGELKEKYIAKDEVSREWVPREKVEKDYVLKTAVPVTTKQSLGGPAKPGVSTVGTNPSTTPDETDEGDFSMHVLQCSSRGTKVVCQLSVINEGEERQLIVAGKSYPPSSRIFDLEGNEYESESIALGSNEAAGGAQILIPIRVPVKAQISFEGVQRGMTSIALLEVQCATWGQKSNNRRLTFRFRNVGVQKH